MAENTQEARRASVLITEDEEGPRDALRVILRPFYTVYEAGSGEEALEILAEREVDVITVDLKLPGIQGTELLLEIKKRRPSTRVVVISGYNNLKGSMGHAMNHVSGFVAKPFHVKELLDVIASCIYREGQKDASRTVASFR